jgi:general stress protein 26
VEQATEQESLKKLSDLIKGIKFAMLTTVEDGGALHSRPMATQDIEFDGDLWFFTRLDSAKVHEIHQDRQVNVSFADPDKQTYVSASGVASVVRDEAKIKELWRPAYKIFFPQGLDDPELALLKVSVQTAEYWNSPGSAVVRMFKFAKAYVTGDTGDLGEHGKVAVK